MLRIRYIFQLPLFFQGLFLIDNIMPVFGLLQCILTTIYHYSGKYAPIMHLAKALQTKSPAIHDALQYVLFNTGFMQF